MENLELNGKSLLFVDDEADLREIVASELEFMGATVYQAENVSAAKMILQSKDVDLVVSDIRMPSGTGIDLLSYIKQQNISVPPIILITGFADISTEDALNLGAEALLSKPFKLDVLIQVAIKLTSPERERYMRSSKRASKDLSFYFEEALTQKLKDHEVAIGRGGIALTVNTMSFRWDTGDVLKLYFKFKDEEFIGTAICRWWKPQEQSNKATFGLEFVQLSDKTLEYFHDYWNQNKIIPFIPSLG